MSIVLIVGGDSKVGSALTTNLTRSGDRVVTTSRRPISPGAGSMHLDLADCASWQPPAGVGVAVLAAARANIETCRQNPREAERVNVVGLLQVARRLQARGAFLVYLSSNAVFGGDQLYPRPDDPPTPGTEYGQQKAEAEKQLRQLDSNVAIIRFGKILDPCVTLFAQWNRALRQGQVIEPFDDMTMAPIPMSCAVTVLRLVMASRQGGTYHASGDQDVSYAQIARWAAEAAGANPALVKPISARQSGRIKAHIPRHTALCIEGLRAAFGIQPPAVEWSIRSALARSN